MRYLKKFEDTDPYDREIELQLFREQIRKSPNFDTHDFFVFIGKDGYKEVKGGLFKKTIEIEKMNRIEPDEQGLGAVKGMCIRVKFTAFASAPSKVYYIWFPKEGRDMIENKSSANMDLGLLELINKHKEELVGKSGGKLYQDALKRKADLQKFDL